MQRLSLPSTSLSLATTPPLSRSAVNPALSAVGLQRGRRTARGKKPLRLALSFARNLLVRPPEILLLLRHHNGGAGGGGGGPGLPTGGSDGGWFDPRRRLPLPGLLVSFAFAATIKTFNSRQERELGIGFIVSALLGLIDTRSWRRMRWVGVLILVLILYAFVTRKDGGRKRVYGLF